MKAIRSLIAILILFTGVLSFAEEVEPTPALEGSIIYVTRKLRMSSSEPAPPKDYYVDVGEHHGVKVGDAFDVYRTTAVLNAINGYASNLIRIYLGEMKVILVGEYTSIGRMSAVRDVKDLPVIDYPNFMLGDYLVQKSNLPTPQ